MNQQDVMLDALNLNALLAFGAALAGEISKDQATAFLDATAPTQGEWMAFALMGGKWELPLSKHVR